MPVLVAWITAGTGAPLHLDVPEHRLRGEVVVPQVVVHELLLPGDLAGARVQRQQRVGEAIRPDAQRRRRSPGWPIRWGSAPGRAPRRPTSRPRRCRAPVLAACASFQSAAAGCSGESGSGSNDHMPAAPLRASNARITPRSTLDGAVVTDRGADDDEVAVDRRRRGDQVRAAHRGCGSPRVRSTSPPVAESPRTAGRCPHRAPAGAHPACR